MIIFTLAGILWIQPECKPVDMLTKKRTRKSKPLDKQMRRTDKKHASKTSFTLLPPTSEKEAQI